MKKLFLKSMVAAAVVGVAVAISSVAAFAATQTVTWSYETDTSTVPDEFGFKTANGDSTLNKTDTMGKSRTGLFAEKIFDNGTNGCFANKTAYDINGCTTADFYKKDGTQLTKKYVGFTPTKTGTIKFYVAANQSGAIEMIFRIYACTASDTEGQYILDEQLLTADLPARDDADSPIEAIAFDVTADTRYYLYGNNGGTDLFQMVFTYDDGKDDTSTIADTVTAIGSDYYAVDSTNKATYIIHAVTADEMKYATLALEGKSGAVAPTTEVYTSVEFADGSTLSASDINADAIYAVKVTGTDGAAPTATFNWIESK
jgi:hypothetical protein